jgi:uncharacterized protein (TIGR02391 family)
LSTSRFVSTDADPLEVHSGSREPETSLGNQHFGLGNQKIDSGSAEKRDEMGLSPKTSATTAFEKQNLHPVIYAAASPTFRDGHYQNAVFEAAKALVKLVKEKANRPDKDGAPLMYETFSRENPTLAFNALASRSDLDEQEGFMHLFVGAVLGVRNPRGHESPLDTPERALEQLGLLSFLANRLEKSDYLLSPGCQRWRKNRPKDRPNRNTGSSGRASHDPDGSGEGRGVRASRRRTSRTFRPITQKAPTQERFARAPYNSRARAGVTVSFRNGGSPPSAASHTGRMDGMT